MLAKHDANRRLSKLAVEALAFLDKTCDMDAATLKTEPVFDRFCTAVANAKGLHADPDSDLPKTLQNCIDRVLSMLLADLSMQLPAGTAVILQMQEIKEGAIKSSMRESVQLVERLWDATAAQLELEKLGTTDMECGEHPLCVPTAKCLQQYVTSVRAASEHIINLPSELRDACSQTVENIKALLLRIGVQKLALLEGASRAATQTLEDMSSGTWDFLDWQSGWHDDGSKDNLIKRANETIMQLDSTKLKATTDKCAQALCLLQTSR